MLQPHYSLLHNVAQAGIHRPDRSPPVRVLALQGDYFRDGRSEIFPFLEDYSRQKGLQFRHGLYTGSGWDVDDYGRVMQQGGEDFGQQLSSYMVRACGKLATSHLAAGYSGLLRCDFLAAGLVKSSILWKSSACSQQQELRALYGRQASPDDALTVAVVMLLQHS